MNVCVNSTVCKCCQDFLCIFCKL